MAVRDDSKERELDTLPKDVAVDLFKFNITQQRIVDLCNAEFDEDWFQDSMHYSTFQRALKGKSAWIEVVQALDNLCESQKANPRRYLPADGPPDAEALAAWMKQIAGAPWWHKVLKLSVSASAFNAWYSGRPMGKDKVAEVKTRVDEWWVRLMFAVGRAELQSLGKRLTSPTWEEFNLNRFGRHFYALVVEDGMPLEEARVLYEDMHVAIPGWASMIDLADPKDPLQIFASEEARRGEFGEEFDAMVAAGFPGAVPRASPDFDPTPWFEEKPWGDRTDENGPEDLNQDLYGRRYRIRFSRKWDDVARNVFVDQEITHTSSDGMTWREATAREKLGWKSGMVAALQAERAGEEHRTGYERDIATLERNLRLAQAALRKLLNSHDATDEQIAAAREALDEAGDVFRLERVRIRTEPL